MLKLTKNVVLFLVFVISLTIGTHVFAEPIVIRFSHVVPENTPKGEMANRFKELVKERIGDDKIVVKVYPNKTLFNDSESLKGLLEGNLELAAPATSKLENITKRLQILDIPFLFESTTAVNNFLNGTYGQRILGLFERKGFKGLGYFTNGMKQLSSNVPMQQPEDLQGLKFRIMNSEVIEDQFKQLGAIPLKLPFSQVNQLIESSKIDGQENTWSNIYSQGFFKRQKYIVESNHGYLGYVVMSSKQFWDKLPEELKPAIETALADAIEYGNEIAKLKAIEDRENIVKSGESNIQTMTLEQRKKWKEAMRPLWDEYENKIGSELIRAAATTSG